MRRVQATTREEFKMHPAVASRLLRSLAQEPYVATRSPLAASSKHLYASISDRPAAKRR